MTQVPEYPVDTRLGRCVELLHQLPAAVVNGERDVVLAMLLSQVIVYDGSVRRILTPENHVTRVRLFSGVADHRRRLDAEQMCLGCEHGGR